MAIAGTFKRQALAEGHYQGARVWGTGINPIHASRDDGKGRILDSTNTYEPGPDDPGIDYGYCMEDMDCLGVLPAYTEDHPNWGDIAPRSQTKSYPRWGMDGNEYPLDAVGNPPMGTGLHTFTRGNAIRRDIPMQIPNETVTEGYRSKTYAQGEYAYARPSDDSQYTMQTSMQQRDQARNNEHAQARGTDDAREPIQSRVAGQKHYEASQGERHYDMTPREQDYILRPWTTRTAGTPPEAWLEGQEMYVSDAVQRQPPSDPYMGVNAGDTPNMDYGYTGEDLTYA
jgi:hypothetical protein